MKRGWEDQWTVGVVVVIVVVSHDNGRAEEGNGWERMTGDDGVDEGEGCLQGHKDRDDARKGETRERWGRPVQKEGWRQKKRSHAGKSTFEIPTYDVFGKSMRILPSSLLSSASPPPPPPSLSLTCAHIN
ncbi:hypothetical protein L6452_22462 [Arctium lappa]|uniref:Uncharacterized protein n=1 Tax=Arctium lappa TaxID=4217 RepID=A0ACB9B0S1_ARCLA|nr:hypothetical protein L6452_22462 [Arctium lappa]